jgi:amino acid transporter
MALWRALVGPPLRADEGEGERIGPIKGLSALSLDALTSVAYGPEAMVLVLATAGASAIHLIWPITIAIAVLLALLVFSYRQVIAAYPDGGGAYAVSRANLGTGASQVAAAALVVDYVLTVAVSIAAGIGSLTSAFPALRGGTVELCLAMLAVITVLNLRGLSEAATAFLAPTLLFIAGIFAVIVLGLFHPLGSTSNLPGHSLTPTNGLQAVGVLLVLQAFAAGCSALTGVEAIANGVPTFREPRVARAKRTELLLGVLLAAMLLGLARLTVHYDIGPRTGQTVLSQLMSVALGRGAAFVVLSLVTTLVLGLAANTSFGGLPVLLSLLSRDHYMPHSFGIRGDRLVFANGIFALAGLSAVLLVVVRGRTDALIPMFAIGVFTGFTLSQSGLVRHWWRMRPPGWAGRLVLNGLGAVVTAIATVVFLVTKFRNGGWVVLVAVPLLILLFHRIAAYYRLVGVQMLAPRPTVTRGEPLTIVPVSGMTAMTNDALDDARALGHPIQAVWVLLPTSGLDADELADEWRAFAADVPLTTLSTPYESVVDPIVRFVDREVAAGRRPVLVVIPGAEPAKLRHRLLHNHIDEALARALRRREGVIIGRDPFRIDDAPTRGRERAPD